MCSFILNWHISAKVLHIEWAKMCIQSDWFTNVTIKWFQWPDQGLKSTVGNHTLEETCEISLDIYWCYMSFSQNDFTSPRRACYKLIHVIWDVTPCRRMSASWHVSRVPYFFEAFQTIRPVTVTSKRTWILSNTTLRNSDIVSKVV